MDGLPPVPEFLTSARAATDWGEPTSSTTTVLVVVHGRRCAGSSRLRPESGFTEAVARCLQPAMNPALLTIAVDGCLADHPAPATAPVLRRAGRLAACRLPAPGARVWWPASRRPSHFRRWRRNAAARFRCPATTRWPVCSEPGSCLAANGLLLRALAGRRALLRLTGGDDLRCRARLAHSGLAPGVCWSPSPPSKPSAAGWGWIAARLLTWPVLSKATLSRRGKGRACRIAAPRKSAWRRHSTSRWLRPLIARHIHCAAMPAPLARITAAAASSRAIWALGMVTPADGHASR